MYRLRRWCVLLPESSDCGRGKMIYILVIYALYRHYRNQSQVQSWDVSQWRL